MPIYEYKCLECGRTSEFLVGVGSEDVSLQCSHCGSDQLHKIFSTYTVQRSGASSGPQHGKTCCGREERCSEPPCGETGTCAR